MKHRCRLFALVGPLTAYKSFCLCPSTFLDFMPLDASSLLQHEGFPCWRDCPTVQFLTMVSRKVCYRRVRKGKGKQACAPCEKLG